MKNSAKSMFFALFVVMAQYSLYSQNSIPFQWTEAMLTAIRNDFARPPMTARTLQHFSMAMYDAWAAYDDEAATLFLGKTFNAFTCPNNRNESLCQQDTYTPNSSLSMLGIASALIPVRTMSLESGICQINLI
jgi:hypothetical protein